MSKKGTAKIWLDEEKGVLVVRAPFSASFIHYIKLHIPKEYRQWNPTNKVWEFEIEQIDRVMTILKECFEKIVELTSLFDRKQTAPTDGLFSIINRDDIKSIYRLLAMKYHPDAGGNSEKMKKINIFFKGVL